MMPTGNEGAGGVVAVVLAAGTGSRFGGDKVLAELDGKPVLQHVLDAITATGIERLVIVLGDAAERAEAAVRWPAGSRRVVNPHPEHGLASSLRLGVEAAREAYDPDAILIALGDQPRIRPEVIHALLAAPGASTVRAPRYPDGANPNPVLLRRAAFPLVERAEGDRGLGPILAANPELVTEIAVTGDNPDVDTPADLERIRHGTARVP